LSSLSGFFVFSPLSFKAPPWKQQCQDFVLKSSPVFQISLYLEKMDWFCGQIKKRLGSIAVISSCPNFDLSIQNNPDQSVFTTKEAGSRILCTLSKRISILRVPFFQKRVAHFHWP
jgi:hypothetical protein